MEVAHLILQITQSELMLTYKAIKMKRTIIIIMLCYCFGCSEKLELKPDSALVLPKTAKDFENLLDNTQVMNRGIGLMHISSDEYFIPTSAEYNALPLIIERSAYTWQSDIFQGQTKIDDWTVPYSQIFISNSVLDLIAKQDLSKDSDMQRVKGWALFCRAYAFYNLLSTFAKAYDAKSADSDLGIPLKLNSSIIESVKRSSLKMSYDQTIKDVIEASELLQQDIILDRRNSPSKVACFALLARIYLSMRKYDEAEIFADKTLNLYSKLTDFNTLPIGATSSFTNNSEEIIFFAQNPYYAETSYGDSSYGVDRKLIDLYGNTDLRRKIYFEINTRGNYYWKGNNNQLGYPFTGLATDEIYLIKAECLARKNNNEEAIRLLNTFLKTRIETTSFLNIEISKVNNVLELVLAERRRSLVWRCLRWTDLKRLNMEGRNITVKRDLGSIVYTLKPNSLKYVLPIPDDEVYLSGIQQNFR